ncbi:MAG: hypothetical protein K2O39_04865, partial [Clostridiales bacterium]|nr:hypothetical protein [Clostridiales bacterium]
IDNGTTETDEAVEADDTDEYVAPQADEFGATDDIEPDRGIYIPEIRTVTPRPTEEKTSSVKKPATAKKPTTKKPAKPKKSGSGGASQRPAGVEGKIPPEKKLPVTRRYVILDRHNAVNMFGEYLKERNQAEKDKLKSSINTIIIE